jgi:hypothetical protein
MTETLTDFWRQFGLILYCRILELTPLEILADACADVLSYVTRDGPFPYLARTGMRPSR